MKKIIFILSIFLFIFYSDLSAQRWKKVRYEVLGGIGISGYLGDLGGGDGPGRPFLSDMDLSGTRFAGNVGLRYRWTDRISTKWNLISGMVNGSDNYSNSRRSARNLSFRSIIIESSLQVEFSIQKEKTGRRYTFINTGKLRWEGVNTYLFTGIGGFYFNPQAKYIDNKWYDLQPLRTEGQGLPGAKESKPYSKIAACFPLGIGFKYGLTRKLNFGVEMGYRFTTTDFLDDVSDSYYDNEKIRIANGANGDVAAYFADPKDNKVPGGQKWRGNPKSRDGYLFVLFNVSMKLRVARNGLPRF